MPKRKAYTLKSAKAKDGSLAIELDNKSKFFLERGSKPVAPRVFTFRWWYTLILVGLFLLGVVGSFLFRAIQQFESAAQTNVWGVAGVVWAGLRQPYFQNHDRLTILLLGVDAVPNRQDTSILTDTMIILSIEPDARIKSVSLPRDLYIPELATKINSLYETGLLTGEPLSSNPVKSVISSITGVEIDYVMVVKLTTVKDLIDATGGIPITVVKSFEDEQYPKDDVD